MATNALSGAGRGRLQEQIDLAQHADARTAMVYALSPLLMRPARRSTLLAHGIQQRAKHLDLPTINFGMELHGAVPANEDFVELVTRIVERFPTAAFMRKRQQCDRSSLTCFLILQGLEYAEIGGNLSGMSSRGVAGPMRRRRWTLQQLARRRLIELSATVPVKPVRHSDSEVF